VGESLNVITAGFAGDLGDEVQAVAQCPVAQRSHRRSSGNVWQQEKSLHRAIDSESLLIDDAVACTYDGDAMVAAGKKKPDEENGQVEEEEAGGEVYHVEKVCPTP